MPFSPSTVVVFGVVRGGSLIAVQSNGVSIQETSPPTNPWAAWTDIVDDTNASVFGTVAPHVPMTGAGANGYFEVAHHAALLPYFQSNARLRFRFQATGTELAELEVHFRSVPSLDLLFVQTGTLDPLPVGAPVPAGLADYTWAATPKAAGALVGAGIAGTPGQNPVFSIATPPGWNIDVGQWDLTVTAADAGAGAASTGTFDGLATLPFSGLPTGQNQPTATLRRLEIQGGGALDGFTYFRRQGSGARAINAPAQVPASGLGINLARTGQLGGAINGVGAVSFDADMRILPIAPASSDHIAWDGDTGLTLFLTDMDGIWPTVSVAGLAFSARQVDAGASYSLMLAGSPGSTSLGVLGGGSYRWEGFSDDLLTVVTVAPANPLSHVGAAFVVEWAALIGGESGVQFTLRIQRDGLNHPDSFDITVDVQTEMALANILVTPTTLPGARERTPYQAVVTAMTSALAAGETLTWQVDDPALVFDPPTTDSLTPNPLQSVLKPIDSAPYIPSWAPSRALQVTITKDDGVGDIEGGNSNAVTLPVEPTMANINAALVLDRSGSMTGLKWTGAINGAHAFASLVKDVNDGPGPETHNVGVTWFSGTGGGDNYLAPAPRPVGVLAGGVGTLGFDQPLDATFLTNLIAAETDSPPGGWTAIGAGMMFARDMLIEQSIADGAPQERVLLVLSDGMQNRPPMIADAVSPARWWSTPAPALAGDLTAYPEDPNVRIYSVALGTSPAWADVLRSASVATGGIGALDVKDIPDASTAAITVAQWFQGQFANLFGYTPIMWPPDPELSAGESAATPVQVTDAHGQVVFSLLAGDGPMTDWEVQLEPPSAGAALTEADLLAAPGIRVLSGPLYKMVIVDRPLQIPGHEHRWAGEWHLHVIRRLGAPAAYAVTAIARSPEGPQVDVVGPAYPIPGSKHTIRATLRQGKRPIERAKVVARVTPPGPWIDAIIAKTAAPLTGRAQAEHQKDDDDALQTVARKVMAERGAESGKPIFVTLQHLGAGIYEGAFTVTRPGHWSIETTAVGARRVALSRETLSKLLGGIRKHWKGRVYERELRAFKRDRVGPQAFRFEDRKTLAVNFVPSRKRTDTSAYMADAQTIRLSVRPRDTNGTPLGAGWAHRIFFDVPGSPRRRLETVDLGDGSYAALVSIAGKELRREHPVPALRARSGLVLKHGGRSLPVSLGRLRFDGFAVEVLGVRLPLEVRPNLVSPKDSEWLRRPLSAWLDEARAAARSRVAQAGAPNHEAIAKLVARTLGRDVARNLYAATRTRHSLSRVRDVLAAAAAEAGEGNRALASLGVAFDVALDRWTELDHSCVEPFFDDVSLLSDGAREVLAALGRAAAN